MDICIPHAVTKTKIIAPWMNRTIAETIKKKKKKKKKKRGTPCFALLSVMEDGLTMLNKRNQVTAMIFWSLEQCRIQSLLENSEASQQSAVVCYNIMGLQLRQFQSRCFEQLLQLFQPFISKFRYNLQSWWINSWAGRLLLTNLNVILKSTAASIAPYSLPCSTCPCLEALFLMNGKFKIHSYTQRITFIGQTQNAV